MAEAITPVGKREFCFESSSETIILRALSAVLKPYPGRYAIGYHLPRDRRNQKRYSTMEESKKQEFHKKLEAMLIS